MAPNFPGLRLTSLLSLQPGHHFLLSLRLGDQKEARDLWLHTIIIRLLPHPYDCLLLLLLLLLLEYPIPNDDYPSQHPLHQLHHRHTSHTCPRITTIRPPHAAHSRHTRTHSVRLTRRTGRPDTWNPHAVRRR